MSTIELVLLFFLTTMMLLLLFAAYNGGFWVRIRQMMAPSASSVASAGTANAPSSSSQSGPISRPPGVVTDPAPSALVIALFASLLASMAWNVKQMVASLTNRAQLRIVETLSAGRSLSRQELRTAMKKETIWLNLFPDVGYQALIALVMAGKVKVEDGKYSLPIEFRTVIAKIGKD